MFSENLKTLRKTRGLSQEELAVRLNVVRQTISKWEKGLSVPDADMLIRIAEVFEVSVSEILGAKLDNENNINILAEQLSRISEQMAVKNHRVHRIWKIVVIIIGIIIAVNIILTIIGFTSFTSMKEENQTTVTDTTEISEQGQK